MPNTRSEKTLKWKVVATIPLADCAICGYSSPVSWVSCPCGGHLLLNNDLTGNDIASGAWEVLDNA